MSNDGIVGRYDSKKPKWLIYYDWGNSFWGVTAWADRDDGAAVYDTQEDAEREAFEIVTEHPELFIGKVSVVPTFERYRRDHVFSEIAERERRAEEERLAFERMMEKRIAAHEEALRKQGWSIKKG